LTDLAECNVVEIKVEIAFRDKTKKGLLSFAAIMQYQQVISARI
jgi:hypothetical protein